MSKPIHSITVPSLPYGIQGEIVESTHTTMRVENALFIRATPTGHTEMTVPKNTTVNIHFPSNVLSSKLDKEQEKIHRDTMQKARANKAGIILPAH